jgi:hypothetical protein
MDTYKYGLSLLSCITSGCDVTQIYLPVDMIVFDLQVERWKQEQEYSTFPGPLLSCANGEALHL